MQEEPLIKDVITEEDNIKTFKMPVTKTWSHESEICNDRNQIVTSTDSDTDFLISLRDDVKALSPQLKLRFKCEVLQLLERLRYPSTITPSFPTIHSQYKSGYKNCFQPDHSCKNFVPSPDFDHDCQTSSHNCQSKYDHHSQSSSPTFPLISQSLKSVRKPRKQTKTARSQSPSDID